MEKRLNVKSLFYFFNTICLIIFFVFIVGIPICKFFLNIHIKKYIELMWIFSTLFIFEVLFFLFSFKNKECLCKTEENNELKLQLLRDVSLEHKKINIKEEQKEIYKIFCNTLVDL